MAENPRHSRYRAEQAVAKQPNQQAATDSGAKKSAEISERRGESAATQTLFVADPLHHEFDDGTEDAGLGNHWSIPWSDLMMVMFVLFAALITAQNIDGKGAPGDQEQIIEVPIDKIVEKDKPVRSDSLSRLPSFEPLFKLNIFERSRQAIRDANLDNVDIALLSDQSVRVSVRGPLVFDSAQIEIRPEVGLFLDKLSDVINKTKYKVNVIGHSDNGVINTPAFPSNWELSALRASRIVRYLVNEGGVDPARFTVMGRSQYDPIESNDSVESRAKNRRVEIVITRDKFDSEEVTL